MRTAAIIPDVSLIYGSSDVDIIADEQELLNTLTDLNVEAILYQLFPERRIDPKICRKVDNLDPSSRQSLPIASRRYGLADPSIKFRLTLLRSATTLKGEIREAASVSEISKGHYSDRQHDSYRKSRLCSVRQMFVSEKRPTTSHKASLCKRLLSYSSLLKLYADDIYDSQGGEGWRWNFEQVDMARFTGEYTCILGQ